MPHGLPMKKALKLTVTAKGQVTLKRSVLRHLGIALGDTLTVALSPCSATLRAARFRASSRRSRHRPGVPRGVSLDDMNAAIAGGWAGQR